MIEDHEGVSAPPSWNVTAVAAGNSSGKVIKKFGGCWLAWHMLPARRSSPRDRACHRALSERAELRSNGWGSEAPARRNYDTKQRPQVFGRELWMQKQFGVSAIPSKQGVRHEIDATTWRKSQAVPLQIAQRRLPAMYSLTWPRRNITQHLAKLNHRARTL